MVCHKMASGHKARRAEAPPAERSLAPRPQTPLADPARACPGLLQDSRWEVEGPPGAAGRATLGMEPGQRRLPTHGHYLPKTQELLQLKHVAGGSGGWRRSL